MVFGLLLLFLPLILILIIIIFTAFPASSKNQPPLPPGPKPWQIVGNLLQLTKKPHLSLQALSKLHGPLITLRLGSKIMIVASSPVAAIEILKTHDRLLSARSVSKVVPYSKSDLDRKSVFFASDCNNDNWKTLRSILKTQMLSARAIETQSAIRERKAAEMVEFIGSKLGEEIDIGEVAFVAVFDSLTNLMFSRDCIGFEEMETAGKLKALIWRLMKSQASLNVADFFPILEKLDPQGLAKEFSRAEKQLCSVWKPYIDERKELRRRGKSTNNSTEDFLDVFFENGLDDTQVNWLCFELSIAGTDTNSATIEWAMAELIRNRGAMAKLRDELKTELPIGKALKESDVYNLRYLNAVVKETLRLHHPAPLFIHRAPVTCEVMNYTIPEGAQVTVNAWAIGRDSSVWGEDALLFKPERFLDSDDVDFRAQDFKLLSFGAGRRSCPGIPLAGRILPLLLAALVRNFDWCLRDGGEAAAEALDMEEKFALSLHKQRPLLLVPRRISE